MTLTTFNNEVATNVSKDPDTHSTNLNNFNPFGIQRAFTFAETLATNNIWVVTLVVVTGEIESNRRELRHRQHWAPGRRLVAPEPQQAPNENGKCRLSERETPDLIKIP